MEGLALAPTWPPFWLGMRPSSAGACSPTTRRAGSRAALRRRRALRRLARMATSATMLLDERPGARGAAPREPRAQPRARPRLVLAPSPSRFSGTRRAGAGGRSRPAASMLLRLAVRYGLDGRTERRVEVGDCRDRAHPDRRRGGPDLIVLGARSPRRLLPGLMGGDLATELKGTSSCPVVVVPTPVTGRPLRGRTLPCRDRLTETNAAVLARLPRERGDSARRHPRARHSRRSGSASRRRCPRSSICSSASP